MSTPAPGIYEGVSFEEYKSWDAMNSSTLKWGQKSMSHLLAAREKRMKNSDTPDRKFGRAVHRRLLEPKAYKEELVVALPCCGIIKGGDNAGNPCGKKSKFFLDNNCFCGTHKPADAVTPEDFVSTEEYERIERLAASVQKHSVVNMFRQQGGCEVSVVWEQSGIMMKARLDKWIEMRDNWKVPPTICDIKKCQVGKTDMDSCEGAVTEYGYHVQAAIYMSAIEAIEGVLPHFLWVFIEDSDPFDVSVIQADDETIQIGMMEFTRLIVDWKRCQETGVYPGVSDKIQQGGLRQWYRKQFQGDY